MCCSDEGQSEGWRKHQLGRGWHHTVRLPALAPFSCMYAGGPRVRGFYVQLTGVSLLLHLASQPPRDGDLPRVQGHQKQKSARQNSNVWHVRTTIHNRLGEHGCQKRREHNAINPAPPRASRDGLDLVIPTTMRIPLKMWCCNCVRAGQICTSACKYDHDAVRDEPGRGADGRCRTGRRCSGRVGRQHLRTTPQLNSHDPQVHANVPSSSANVGLRRWRSETR